MVASDRVLRVVLVGDLVPANRPELVILAFHLLQTHIVPSARLAIIGAGRDSAYGEALARLVGELALTGVRFADGGAADSAAVVVTTRPDGPPVLSSPAGLRLPADTGPELLAEALASSLVDAA